MSIIQNGLLVEYRLGNHAYLSLGLILEQVATIYSYINLYKSIGVTFSFFAQSSYLMNNTRTNHDTHITLILLYHTVGDIHLSRRSTVR